MTKEIHPPLPTTRMRQFAPLALVLVGATVAVAAYLQALDYPFVSDDLIYITINSRLAGLHLTELWHLFVEPYNTAFEFLPLRELSYWFDMTLFGMNPAAFRVHNIILYLLCLPLVYCTTLGVWRYFRPTDVAAPWAAATVTALFAVHPAHVETVVFISGRKDVLSAMFSLLALWFAVHAKREQGFSSPHATATLVVLLAAMYSKATAIAVAPVIALLWLIFWRDIPVLDRRRSLLWWPLACLLLAACVALIFSTIITSRVPFYFGVEAVTRSLAVLGWLARLTVSPENHHYFYPVFEDPYLPVMVVLGVAILAAAAAGGVIALRRRSLEGFALAAFFLICMPSIQLVPYMPPSLVSDRFVALAVWPVMLLVVSLSWRLKPLPRAALLLVIALPWCFQTMERPRDWRSFEAIIDADLRASPGYYMPAMYKIGGFQLPQGLYREAGDTANSITAPEFRDIMVGLVKAEYVVRVKSTSTGNPQEAMTLLWGLGPRLKQPPAQSKWNSPILNIWDKCQTAFADQWESLAKQYPDDVTVRYNAGLWLLELQYYQAAVTHLRAAIDSQHLPESVRGQAFKNLGLSLLGSGHVAEAEEPLRAALGQQQPDMRIYCLLAVVYKQTGRLEEAVHAEASCPNRASSEKTAQ